MRVHYSKLRLFAQEDVAGTPKKDLKTKKQRDRQIRKLQELIDSLQPQMSDPSKGDDIKNVITQLQQQIQSIKKINEIGSDYYNWLQYNPEQAVPSELDPKKWDPKTKWKTPKMVPTSKEEIPGWDEPEQPPIFPPAQMPTPVKYMETVKDDPSSLPADQQSLDQAALEQKALDIDQFIIDVEDRAGEMLTLLRDSDPETMQQQVIDLVKYLYKRINDIKPVADSLLMQIGGVSPTQKTYVEDIDTSDFEQYFPEV